MGISEFFTKESYGSYICGSFVLHDGMQTHDFFSPVTDKVYKHYQGCHSKMVTETIAAAYSAFQQWKQIPPPRRAQRLREIGDLILQHKDDFSHMITMEMGKPLQESQKEVLYTAGYFHWYAGEAERIYGKIIPSQLGDKTLHMTYEPLGVCGVISPWNFPIAMSGRKIAAALAAGCAVIAKPSIEAPFSTLALAAAAREADVPPGVLNVIFGPDQEIGREILDSPLVRKISFTGSIKVGQYLYKESAQTLKKLTLELGGNAPFIVFDDADLSQAVSAAVAAKFRNNGQSCIAANRFYVQEGIYEEFVKQFAKATRKLKVGDPLDPNTQVSQTLHPASAEKAKILRDEALELGAHLVLGGNEPWEPTILSEVLSHMSIFSEEIFAPLAGVAKFSTIDEAISLSNATVYGLAAYVFTRDLQKAHKVVSELDFGIIGLNDGLPSAPQATFGGVKQSGFGREGGPTGIYEYLSEKFISQKN